VEPSDIARHNAEILTGKKIFKTIDNIDQTFDVITLWHVLEHIPNINETISQLKTKLSQNGTMFIAVPNHKSNDAKRYKEAWAGYDVPRHLWHFSIPNMTQILNMHQLAVKQILPMKLDAFYVSMLSEKYLTGTIGPLQILTGFTAGLKSNIKAKSNNQYSSLIYVVRK
jgi:hypothetical protein